eukprot:8566906-Alexandrium_andersonii.AAC.1
MDGHRVGHGINFMRGQQQTNLGTMLLKGGAGPKPMLDRASRFTAEAAPVILGHLGLGPVDIGPRSTGNNSTHHATTIGGEGLEAL